MDRFSLSALIILSTAGLHAQAPGEAKGPTHPAPVVCEARFTPTPKGMIVLHLHIVQVSTHEAVTIVVDAKKQKTMETPSTSFRTRSSSVSAVIDGQKVRVMHRDGKAVDP